MSGTERCEIHGCELSTCGEMTEDGPSSDCKECQLDGEISALKFQLAGSKHESEALRVQIKGLLGPPLNMVDDASTIRQESYGVGWAEGRASMLDAICLLFEIADSVSSE